MPGGGGGPLKFGAVLERRRLAMLEGESGPRRGDVSCCSSRRGLRCAGIVGNEGEVVTFPRAVAFLSGESLRGPSETEIEEGGEDCSVDNEEDGVAQLGGPNDPLEPDPLPLANVTDESLEA